MRKAGDIINALFGPELAGTAVKSHQLFRSWTDITEKNHLAAAGAHSRIREFERNVVLIEADHPGWIQLLQTKQRKFLYDFQRRFPDMGVMGISFVLSREPAATENPVREPEEEAAASADNDSAAGISGSPAEEAAISSALEKIHDKQLKAKLRRLEKEIARQNREPPS